MTKNKLFFTFNVELCKIIKVIRKCFRGVKALPKCLKHALMAIFAVVVFSATNVYASGFLDVNYVNCLKPYAWNYVPANTFEDSGVSGTYKILLDKENGCLYFAFFVNEPSATQGADESDVRITVDIESSAFTKKHFEFFNGEQPEDETSYNVITKSSAEFTQMDNVGMNVISGYLYTGFYFEKENERTSISVTANYTCGDSSKTIFKDVLLDMTYDADIDETETVVQTETVHHESSSENAEADERSKTSEQDEDEETEETKYTGKALLDTTQSANKQAEDETKFTAQSGVIETTSATGVTEGSDNTAVKSSSGLSNSSIALLCAASVLCTGGIGAIAAGIAAQAKNSAVKGDEKNE